MTDLEKRIAALEAWRNSIEPHVNRSIPLGPRPLTDEEIAARSKKFSDEMMKIIKKDIPPVDRTKQQLVSGAPVPEDRSHTELKYNGQQKDYIVLSPEERAKGFVRPVRQKYRHRGTLGPQYPLRDLTPEQHDRYDQFGYVKFEAYPESESSATGKYWTQAQLDNIGKGCDTITTMSVSIAETYARDPHFYGGTFCCGCNKHLPLDEFVWHGTDETVGS